MIVATTPDKVAWLDQYELQAALQGRDRVRHSARLSALLAHCGVPFRDPEKLHAAAPVVLIRTLGGLPIRIVDGAPRVAGLSVGKYLEEARYGMGFAAMDTYLNPKDKHPLDIYRVNVMAHGVPSIAHTVHLGFFVAGLSLKAELEFCTQRDLVHLSRLTSARTSAQDDPPILVEDTEMMGLYADLRKVLSSHSPSRAVDREIRNAAWPLAKCSILGITGSLKNLLKMTAMADDQGKEAEVRRIASSIRTYIHALFPELEPA